MKYSERGYGEFVQTVDEHGARTVSYSDDVIGIGSGALLDPNTYGLDIREDGLLQADEAGAYVYRPIRFAPTDIVVCERVHGAAPSRRAVLHLDIPQTPPPPFLRVRCPDGVGVTTQLTIVAADGTETPVQDIVEKVTITITGDDLVKAEVTFTSVDTDVVAKEAS